MVYFFDTSALVKRYHREPGTEVVDDAFDDLGTDCVISDLGIVEFYSAFAKKVRVGELPGNRFETLIQAFGKDVRTDTIQVLSLDDEDKRSAVSLIETYGVSQSLRTLDAMQLAVMRSLGPDQITTVYCADRQFVEVIEREGFSVVNPETVDAS